MKFLKFKLRPKSFIVFVLAVVFIFASQYFTIQNVAKSHDEDAVKKLDVLAKHCREGDQKACNDYQTLLEREVPLKAK
ncbi:hypothetical protein [Helicobacter trogontum]|uniref:hypothetical protein n=1 Tax=Helicobacter trogontum TaxID=50960 RepID=UPI000CF0DC9F|nr:hypothetical protein [Helicobacter trogontum]